MLQSKQAKKALQKVQRVAKEAAVLAENVNQLKQILHRFGIS
ncbi:MULTISPECIES: hypothetical protein [Anoxybacillus]|uniref:Uncharacterized protein n=1 Tax=Anoxybacillus flavithermus TaxID=33934 RepID=A0A178TEB8_9BACL|nr:hypothetical protein [Anoxybacillus flavithermus]OAO78364.1 hypothetical protein TAF16_1919 [Anoxybacillus flavithermus]OAO79424.1 hypothetical protein A0O32_1761 [Anoxybacillus flavithermus]